jgi:ribonuclease PH
MINRSDGREPFEMRKLILSRNFLPQAEGSCLVEMGNTRVIVTASVESSVPPWMAGKGTGWVTAEYGMLPRSTHTRNRRAATSGQQNGRTLEIQRLIGRSLRAITDFAKLGEKTVYVDCDVLSADGGTRVSSIIGATVALYDANRWLLEKGKITESFMNGFVAAISVGMHEGEILVDLAYDEDSTADVDMNIIMTDAGRLVEIQGTAEHQTFDRSMLNAMLDAAEPAIQDIISIQKETLGL